MATPTPDEIWKILKENAVQAKATDARIEALGDKISRIGERLDGVGDNIKETDELTKRIGRQLGGLGNNIGSAAEEYFFRGSERTKQIAGIAVDEVLKNVLLTTRVGGKWVVTEVDLLGLNGDSVLAFEVKHNAHPGKVGELTESKVAAVKRAYPDFKVYFGIASMVTNDALKEAAREAGVFLLTQGGENIKVVNDQVKAF